ncbi:MAG: PQQ-dependent sugar dehydrogenase [Gammaproteobacteria bacterium]|nr:PQQ-dependent sugar dehydrogenase [Gammaproteobacteria bacterium]
MAASACPEPVANAVIPSIALKEIATGLHQPVHITGSGDGSHRLYVVEQAGTIRVIDNGHLQATPFLDLSSNVESGGEKGLFSVAFHPRYRANGALFIDYTARVGGKLVTHVSRLQRGADGRADATSEQVLLEIEQPYANHNGGQLAFGPDGMLYIGMGDGGSANDPHGNGQKKNALLGKLLRIDVDRTDPGKPYAIPTDNPFRGQAAYRPEIWALGLRNPWRFSFDAGNGWLYLADVGQSAREEIDVIDKGGNYGWNIMEGDICTPGVNPKCDATGLKPPIHTYHYSEFGFSITGGFVYRGRAVPGLCGTYLYGDYVSKRLAGLRYDGHKVTRQQELIGPSLTDKIAGKLGITTLPNISSFGQDDELELYVADHSGGRVLKIVAP